MEFVVRLPREKERGECKFAVLPNHASRLSFRHLQTIICSSSWTVVGQGLHLSIHKQLRLNL